VTKTPVLRLNDHVIVSYTELRRKHKYVRLRRRPYIHACQSYVYTPRGLDRHASHKSLEASQYNEDALADSSDFGLLGSKVPQNVRFPAY